MTVYTGAVFTGCAILAALAVWQYEAASAAKQQVAMLQHQVSEKQSERADIAKRACSDRSQRYFTSLGYDEAKAADDVVTTFQNHYSKRFDRCLMTIESTSFKGPRQVISKSLIDADERKTFGDFGWVSSETLKYDEQKPMQCTMSPPDKDVSYCHTTEEYDNYVKAMLSS